MQEGGGGQAFGAGGGGGQGGGGGAGNGKQAPPGAENECPSLLGHSISTNGLTSTNCVAVTLQDGTAAAAEVPTEQLLVEMPVSPTGPDLAGSKTPGSSSPEKRRRKKKGGARSPSPGKRSGLNYKKKNAVNKYTRPNVEKVCMGGGDATAAVGALAWLTWRLGWTDEGLEPGPEQHGVRPRVRPPDLRAVRVGQHPAGHRRR